MENYFLISEFAKLRGININSLRYYEKIGILKPAHIDEKTNYRYYSAEQLVLLNKIILCIQLGISLKEMATYIDENGDLQSQKLLEQGKIVAQNRIREMENNLKYIESSLKSIDENKKFAGRQGIYYRSFEERKVITTDIYEGGLDVKNIVSEVAKLYKIAQENEFFPVLPAGQMLQIDKNGKMNVRFFLEVLNGQIEHPMITTIPAGEYSCLQVELEPGMDVLKLVRENWAKEEQLSLIIDNVMLEKYSFTTRPSELQKLERKIS